MREPQTLQGVGTHKRSERSDINVPIRVDLSGVPTTTILQERERESIISPAIRYSSHLYTTD